MTTKLYSYDYEKLSKSFEKFQNEFGILKELKNGDKVGFDDSNNIYISVSSYIQGLTRWFYSQKRDEVFRKLDDSIQDYLLYLQYVDDVYTNTTSLHYANIVKQVITRISSLSTSIINALDILRTTYQDDNDIIQKILRLKNSIDYRTRQLTDYCW